MVERYWENTLSLKIVIQFLLCFALQSQKKKYLTSVVYQELFEKNGVGYTQKIELSSEIRWHSSVPVLKSIDL